MTIRSAEPFVVGQPLWRLLDRIRANWSLDYDGEYSRCGSSVVVHWQEWHADRLTPKGAWIRTGKVGDSIYSERKWVRYDTRFVSRTKAEARELALHRRRYHLKMEQQRLVLVQQRLAAIERTAVSE